MMNLLAAIACTISLQQLPSEPNTYRAEIVTDCKGDLTVFAYRQDPNPGEAQVEFETPSVFNFSGEDGLYMINVCIGPNFIDVPVELGDGKK